MESLLDRESWACLLGDFHHKPETVEGNDLGETRMSTPQLPAQRTPSQEGGVNAERGAHVTCSDSCLCYKVACQVIIES